MSSASPHASALTTTTCPWTSTATAKTPKSPKLQEILDEEFARQLQELELQQMATEYVHVDVGLSESLYDDEDKSSEEAVSEAEEEEEEDGENQAEDEDEDFYYDDADEADDLYVAKNSTTRGMGSRRRYDDASKLRFAGAFDDRTRFVLGKLAARGILSAVDSRVHASATSLLHHGSNLVAVEGSDETNHVHYAVKILKASAIDHGAQKTAESLQQSNRPMNDEMMWMSVRRQLKIQMDREYTSLVRAVASGVCAPAPVCSWEHVMVMAFVGTETKAAPRLRDVVLNQGQLAQGFVQLLSAMRAMYQQAKLVHGGLNEYSILYHNDACWITDFSSAIDTSHTEHIEALAHDVAFVHDFFANNGMPKASKHSVGLLHESTMRELITEEAPGKVLGAFPWIKPYLYKKK